MNKKIRLDILKLLFIGLGLFLAGCSTPGKVDAETSTNSAVNAPAKNNSDGLAALIMKDAEFSEIPKTVKLTKQPYLNGKIRILAREPKVPGFRGYELKVYEERLAKSPEEVGTIILLDFKQNRYGTYEEVSPFPGNKPVRVNGYFWTCEMTVIDRSIPAVIYKETFKGNKPDQFVRADEKTADSVNGTKPDASIIYFLNSTPMK